MGKAFNPDELDQIEITFSKDDQNKLDQIIDLNTGNATATEKQIEVLESLDKSLNEITSVLKNQIDETKSLLKTFEQSSSIANQELQQPEVVEDKQKPVIDAIQNLKETNQKDNLKLIDQIETVKTDGIRVDNKDTSEQLDRLNKKLDELVVSNQNDTKVINDNRVKTNEILENNLTQAVDNLNQINTTNTKSSETESNIVNDQTLNNFIDNQQNVNSTLLQSTSNIENVVKNDTSTQNQIVDNQNLQTKTFQNSIEQINNSVDNVVKSNETTLQNQSVSNQTNSNIENNSLVKNYDNFLNVETVNNQQPFKLNEAPVKVISNNETLEQNTNNTNSVSNLSNNKETNSVNVEKNVSTSTEKNVSTVNDKEKTNSNKDILDALTASIQIQSAMVNLLQELVSNSNIKRYSDIPIKN